jgi:two-component system LytT family sensor kinase
MKWFWRYKVDHILFWIITVLFYSHVRFYLVEAVGITPYLLDILVRNVLIALACYINICYLSPLFLKKRKYLLYSFAALGSLALLALTKNKFDVWLNRLLTGTGDINFLYNTYFNFSIFLFYVVFTMALDTSKKWFWQQVFLKKIQMENLETELRYLKAQMNPHFLFNSINTIYFQIDKKNLEARTSLQKFAELLRYQLYECNEDIISIEKEIDYLKSYIDLQRLRKNDKHSITFQAADNVKGFHLAPLLLLPFVENAFKHLSTFDSQLNWVEVSLSRENGHFDFDIRNSKNDIEPSDNCKGIGLRNVQRRLQLLYPDKYQLSIENCAYHYRVNLKIQLQ